MAEPDKNAPQSVIVTCPTCHERIEVRLTEDRQSVRCTYCKAPVSVPSREQVRSQQAVKTNYPAPTVEEYALAAADDGAPAKPARVKTGGKKKREGRDEITLECPTCHEFVKATIGERPGRIPCTFCETPLAVPDRQTWSGWQAKKIEPPRPAVVGDYAAGPVHQGPRLRPGGVFDRLAEVRQEAVPLPPQWTFFSGVFLLPWRNDTIVRWVYLSLGFTLIMIISLVLKGLAASFSGMSSGIAAAFFALPIIWISYLTFSYTAACGLCVLESTAAGLDRIEGWPDPNWKEWMAQFIYVGWIGAIPLAVSYGLAVLCRVLLPTLHDIPPVLSMTVALFVIYPISLMSALEANSIWVPLTKSILGSLFKWWWCWLMFYLLSGLLLGGIVATIVVALSSSNDYFLIGLGPLLAAAALIYFRLLGRLGWRMTTNVRKTRMG